MAKAVFHKGERVYVKPVGTWAKVESVLPHWVKGVEEPLKVHYDVGLGREFQAHELMRDQKQGAALSFVETEHWRIIRARSRWALESSDTTHPHPGTFPVVVTDAQDWGGWRTPATEYERDPQRIEHQARIIVNAVRLSRLAAELTAAVEALGSAAPEPLSVLARDAETILAAIYGAQKKPNPEQEDFVSPQLR